MGAMNKLFVEKSIAVNAPASHVWTALTERRYTDAWAETFSSGGPRFHLESDWQPGSPVLWKSEDGTVIVEGTVTLLEPNKRLRFTVFDTRSTEKFPVTEEDGITFNLAEHPGQTTLSIRHGDFSVMAEGQFYHEKSAEIWNKVLPKIKALAESIPATVATNS